MLIDEGDLVWPLTKGVCDYPTGLSDDLKALAEELAVDWLWSHTAQIYGTRPAVYRPQTRSLGRCGSGWISIPYLQSIYGPLWPGSLGAEMPREILELPGPAVPPGDGVGTNPPPITVDLYDATTAVHTALTSTGGTAEIRLEGDYLVRQDGDAFPDTQNLIARLSSKNTWAVNYVRGVEVPTAGQIVAARLACEFAKALSGDTKCLLPANVTSATRGGVTIQRDVVNAMSTTRIAMVDQWVREVNPNQLQQAPRVWSPDVVRNGPPFAGSL